MTIRSRLSRYGREFSSGRPEGWDATPTGGPDPFRGHGGPEAAPQRKEVGDFEGSMTPAPPAKSAPYQRSHESDRAGAVSPNPNRATNTVAGRRR